jgi:DNA-directed RNA polymerase subunit K/omega
MNFSINKEILDYKEKNKNYQGSITKFEFAKLVMKRAKEIENADPKEIFYSLIKDKKGNPIVFDELEFLDVNGEKLYEPEKIAIKEIEISMSSNYSIKRKNGGGKIKLSENMNIIKN